MNYVENLIDMYNDINIWAYMHINTAHEASGLHARTLDNDLQHSLSNFVRKYSKTHDLFFLV